MKKMKVVCCVCDGENVRVDSYAMWDAKKQKWVLDTTYDTSWCMDCDAEHNIDYVEIKK